MVEGETDHVGRVSYGFQACWHGLLRSQRAEVPRGRWINAPSGGRRLLDDHLHDVPDPVYELLREVAATTPQPLTVILERDGRYPVMSDLLAQLERAHMAVAAGRLQKAA